MSAADIPIQQTPKALIPKFREESHSVLGGCDCGTLSCGYSGIHFLLNTVSTFERAACRCRRHTVRLDRHAGRERSGIAVMVKFPPAMIFPPAIVDPVIPAVTMHISVFIHPAIGMPTLFPMLDPHPVFLPPGRPNSPCGICDLGIRRNGGRSEIIVTIIGYRIGRIVTFDVGDVGCDRALGSSFSDDTDADCAYTRFRGSVPLYPYQLAVTFRVIDIPNGIGASLNRKQHFDRIIRVSLPSAYLYRCDHISVHSVFIVVGGHFRRFGDVIETDNTNAQGGDNLIVIYLLTVTATPCRVAQIRFFQKDCQRQILMGQRRHLSAEATADHPVIERCLRCGHTKVLSVVMEVRNGFNDDLIGPIDQCVEIHTYMACQRADHLLIGKVTSDCINVSRIITGGDNSGQALCGIEIGVATDHRRQGCTSVVGKFAHLSEMNNTGRRLFVGQIYGPGDDRVGFGIDHRHPDTIHAGIPVVGRSAIAHAATTTVDIAITGGIGRNSKAQQHNDREQKRKDSLHGRPPFQKLRRSLFWLRPVVLYKLY